MQRQAETSSQLDQLETVVKSHLEKDALARFGTIRAADPEKGQQLVMIIAQLIQQGRVRKPLTDDELKMILTQLSPPKKEFRITRN